MYNTQPKRIFNIRMVDSSIPQGRPVPTRSTKTVIPGYSKTWYNGPSSWQDKEPTLVSSRTVDYVEGDLRETHGNYGWQSLGPKSSRVGGDFIVVRKEYSASTPFTGGTHFSAYPDPMDRRGGHYQGGLNAVYTGISDGVTGWPSPVISSKSVMDGLGTKAISISAPTSPIFDGMAALGEIREGLPTALGSSTWQEKTRIASQAGDEYLNYAFGWAPMVSDIQKFSRAVRDSDKILKRYEENSGKPIKVRVSLPGSSSTVYKDIGSAELPQPDLVASVANGVKKGGKLTSVLTTTSKRWFEGCFTYYLPPKGTAAGHLARANKLYGVRLTPDVLWQLTPWSWAVDWFTNLGDITKNMSLFANDGLVLRYGYAMEEVTSTRRYDLVGVEFRSHPGQYSFSETFKTVTKQRRVANPYGFSASSWTGMTSRQKAIVAALGLTKAR